MMLVSEKIASYDYFVKKGFLDSFWIRTNFTSKCAKQFNATKYSKLGAYKQAVGRESRKYGQTLHRVN